MKKLINLLIGLLFLVSPLYSAGFQSLNSGISSNLNGILFIDANTGYAVGSYGVVIKTTNSGLNWYLLNTNTTEALFAIHFVNPLSIYVSGSNGIMLKTTNGGINWSSSYPSTDVLFDFCFDQTIGYAVGASSICLKTTNGGASWVNQQVPLSYLAVLTSVVFNSNKGFVGVRNSTSNLLVTTNGGVNWLDSKIRSGDIGTCGISFVGSSGLIVGYEFISSNIKPLVFTTSNNGEGWTERPIFDRRASLYSGKIYQSNSNIMYACGGYANDPTYGNKGLVLYSTNGGINWIEEAWNSDVSFKGLCFSPTDVYAVGTGGVIIKSTLPVGIAPIGSEIPNKYSLSQNYPNPFNPTTNIEFSVPKNGKVKISVFDINGKEVSVLLNQVLSAGTYKADFNAGNLSSGTYFYRLQADGYSATKKMVLIK